MSSKRKLSDWMTAYEEYTDVTEPPKSFHIWTGLSVIASALQRKVYMNWMWQRIFPNMYIVLVGPSGRCKKGTAMNMGKDILNEVKIIKTTADSMTREALIKAMIEAESSFPDPDGLLSDVGGLVIHSSLTVFSDELSVFLGQNDIKFLANLTDWYDCKDKFDYETRGRGKEQVTGICLNLLGGTAPDWFQSILPEEAIGGGFTSRIFFIVEERKRKTVSYHEPTNKEKQLRKYLAEDLERISKLKGYYEFTESARDIYTTWYEDSDRRLDNGELPVKDPRFAGYSDRRATHIKKLCMVFAASRSNNLIIDGDDFSRALEVMEKAEINMPKAFSGLGSADNIKVTEKIIKFFQKTAEEVKKETILIQFYGDLDVQTWEIISDQLKAMKYLQEINDLGKISYKWTGPRD